MPKKKGTNKNSKISIVDNNTIIQSAELASLMNAYFANLGAIKSNENDQIAESETESRERKQEIGEDDGLNLSTLRRDSMGDKESNELNISIFLECEVKVLIDKIISPNCQAFPF